jgi:hypothetical protein
VTSSVLEDALRSAGDAHGSSVYEVAVRFPLGCKMMIDAAVRLLSLANQLAFTTRRVRLEFDEGEMGTMGYLNRMGFFDHLDSAVEVTPSRPSYSGAKLYSGGNKLKIGWVPSYADTSHATLLASGGRDYASNGWGLQRKDFAA